MNVEQFAPQAAKNSSKSADSQTTTLDIPAHMIEEQHNEIVSSVDANEDSNRTVKAGFMNQNCPKV